jgi:2-isopropylmalate synthase
MTESGAFPVADVFRGRAYDWNTREMLSQRPLVMDETLRDGLQSASAKDPPIETKLDLLRMMAELQIDCATLGYPASRERQFRDSVALAKFVADERLAIEPYFIARAVASDIDCVAEVSQRAGTRVGVGIFLGSSPVRQYVEGWTLDHLARLTDEAVSRAVGMGLSVLFVTEDSTRTPAETLERLYLTAVRAGAAAVCIADTVGHATPTGAARLVSFVRGVVGRCRNDVLVDWHGHSDRGLAVANSLSAWAAGADRCHGTALGVGERSGNAALELLLLNLVLEAQRQMDLTSLPQYVSAAASALGYVVPPNNPVAGRDAFRAAAGVHAAALNMAIRSGPANASEAAKEA